MATQFQHLFTPIQIGPIQVKNRIVSLPHGTRFQFHRDNEPIDQYIEYQRARAKGGCGLIILQPLFPHKSGSGFAMIEPCNPEIITVKLKKMGEVIHEHGAKVIQQISHRGCEADSIENVHALWGFTERPSPTSQEVCHEMGEDEIQEVIEGHVIYARCAKEAGLDGVELHGSHGYLIQQSWSPYANQRTDKWGQDRLLFIREVITRIRDEVGKRFVVGLRMTTDDWWPGSGGMGLEDMKEIARKLEATGKIDYICCSEGSQWVHYSLSIATMYFPPAPWVPLASSLRQVLQRIPLIAVCRINDAVLAEKILADGHADLVGLCRGLITDPEFANKAKEGRLDDIRQCIACNQGCADNFFSRIAITCIQNATVGKEWKMGTDVLRASKRKKVLVIGGGPGGMEAARVAILRGHDVTLMEKENQLGGQVNTITKVPCREEFGNVTRYLVTQIKKLGVKIVLGVEVTEDIVKRENPDAVIVAMGAKPFIPDFPGSSQQIVVTILDVLQGKRVVGKRVVIVDTTGKQEAYMTAEFLADQGKQVRVVTPLQSVGAFLGPTNQPTVLQRLRSRGVDFISSTQLNKISKQTITLSNIYSNSEYNIEDVDTVVMATGYRANNSLYRALKGKVSEIYAVGDCVAPRRTIDAIHEGYNTARTL